MSASVSGLTCKVSITRPQNSTNAVSGRRGRGTPTSVLSNYDFRIAPETSRREGGFLESGIDEFGTFVGTGSSTTTAFEESDIVTVTSPNDNAYINDTFIILNVTKVPGAGGKLHHLFFRLKKET